MDTGRFFNQKEARNCTQLTRQQLRTLEKNGLIEPLRNPLRYTLVDVVYCRLIYRLRQVYSLYQLKEMLLPADRYGGALLVKKYAIIKEVKGSIFAMELLDTLPEEVVKKLEKSYYYIERKQLKDKFTNQDINVDSCYIDIQGIRVEIIDFGYRYEVTSLAEKFA